MSLLHGLGDFFAMDIGTNVIRLVQLKGNAEQGWDLQRYGYFPISSDIMQDSSDNGKRKLSEAITTAVKQADIRTKNIAVGMPSHKTYTTVIETQTMPISELQKTIKYQLEQYIPMSLDKAKVDYAILGISPNDPKKTEVLISSVENSYAEEMMEQVEGMGFNVIAQEPDQIAMARSLSPINVKDARMIIDLGEKSTDLVVNYSGAPRLVRSIPGGLTALVRTVSVSLGVKEEHARQFILKYGLAQDKLEGQVFRALDYTLENFASELQKSVRFFRNKYPNVPFGGIVLSGFAGVIPFISEYIEAKTNIPTSQGNPWQMVRVTGEQQKALINVASEFSVVLGLAERSND